MKFILFIHHQLASISNDTILVVFVASINDVIVDNDAGGVVTTNAVAVAISFF